jgi:hypothetical protein
VYNDNLSSKIAEKLNLRSVQTVVVVMRLLSRCWKSQFRPSNMVGLSEEDRCIARRWKWNTN